MSDIALHPMNSIEQARALLEEIRVLCGEEMVIANDGGFTTKYPDIRRIAGNAERALRSVEQTGDPAPTVEEVLSVNSTDLIGDVRKEWESLTDRGEDGPHALTEDPWRSYYGGWLQGRASLLSMFRSRLTALYASPKGGNASLGAPADAGIRELVEQHGKMTAAAAHGRVALEALKVDRESLRLLELAVSQFDIPAKYFKMVKAHTALLKTRLGMEP